VAATLTDSGELTYLSFGIDKVESTPDGDLMCYGRASDGGVDHDQQIVDPRFSAKAISDWLATGGNVRVQHNAQRDPAGIGLEVNTDESGATWVKSLIIEPVAKKLVAKGALRAYSVGIARPTIERDPTGKARGGIITAGEVVEISIVDRPANARCGISLVKSAQDGTPEYVGEVFGSDDDIAKALGTDVTKAETAEKSIAPAEPAGIDTWTAPDDLSLKFTPDDMMRLVQSKFVEKHYDELALKAIADAEASVYKRDIDTATRRRLAADGKALPNLSYPIENTGDLQNAATLARSGHGDVAAARRLIARRARELGVANPLDEGDDVKKSTTVTEQVQNGNFAIDVDVPEPVVFTPKGPIPFSEIPELVAKGADAPTEQAEATPDVIKDPDPKPVKKAKKKPKKLPPWLNKPKDDDGDSGSEGDDGKDDDDKACKSVSDHLWTGVEGTSDIVCSKCHTTPAQAAGVTASPMSPAPVGELMESDPVPSTVSKAGPTPASASGAVGESMTPVPAHREPDGAPMEAFEASAKMSDGDGEKPTRTEAATGMKTAAPDLSPSPEVAAILRFQRAGIDPEAGRLHDLTCPAYHPEAVAKYHPFADFASAIDIDVFQRQAVKAAAGGDLARAKAMQQVWQAAVSLKAADPGWLNDCRLDAFKAFRDANPGPSTYPTPGSISPQSYNRPLVTEGHEATSPGHDGPNSSPQVATSAPNAHSFDRPPLASGHQSPSPSHMKASFEYPDGTGQPQRLNYAMMEKDRARQALMQVHEHLSRQFPEACPISLDGPQQPESRPVPPTAGIGKSIDPEPAPEQAAPAAALKAEPEDAGMFMDADVYKGFKKMRKKLGKKVLAGKMTVDEARAKMGRQFAQKSSGEEAVQKSFGPAVPIQPVPVDPAAAQPEPRQWQYPVGGIDAVIAAEKTATAEAVKAAVAEATTELKDLLVKQQETFTTKLAEQQRVIDAIADQPDPSTAAFSGLAYKNPVQKAARPAAVPDIAESAARAQDMIRRNLQSTYYTHSSPAVREAAGQELAKLGWEPSMT